MNATITEELFFKGLIGNIRIDSVIPHILKMEPADYNSQIIGHSIWKLQLQCCKLNCSLPEHKTPNWTHCFWGIWKFLLQKVTRIQGIFILASLRIFEVTGPTAEIKWIFLPDSFKWTWNTTNLFLVKMIPEAVTSWLSKLSSHSIL